ncbi:unnamed protein product [Microthlaspi erraticum]|uniref:Transposase Tnp1/En/Spm-like domain-containing protein n=1 Tax=Microthlaspi erraticum TaxID=1685480 RepID=A0A6D2K6V3_9BRAS|nr:unnamed protein product [Microthlaspi erraticum]
MRLTKKATKKRGKCVDDEPEYIGHEEGQPAGEGTEPQVGTEEDPLSHTNASDVDADIVQPLVKKRRGPTKMKDIAKDPNARIRVDFTEFGEPCGKGSVKLSSYLGPLVREHVPINIADWRKIGAERQTVLWKSVQARFELDTETEETIVMRQMGCIWRSSKSRLVEHINLAKNNAERMKLRPKNISTVEWRKFIKEKTSEEFKVLSEKYKEIRRKQIPHTCSRKGMVRLAEDLKKESSDASDVTRLKVWVRSRTKKDGTAVNTKAADTIKKASELVESKTPAATNPKQDLLSQVLGPDNPGRLRAMGRGMSMSKYNCFQMKSKYMTEMQQQQMHLQQQVHDLQETLAKMRNQRSEPEVGENSAPRSVNKKAHPKCILYDWSGSDAKVAEGRILSSDPEDFINDIPLGPNSLKVLVEDGIDADAFLWRPAPDMSYISQAVGGIIAWPSNFVVTIDHDEEPEDIALKSPNSSSTNLCKLMDWTTNDEAFVAEGRWHSSDPKALVNGLPLGPSAVKVFVDVAINPDTFLWRPTAELTNLEDSLKSFVAWPLNRVHFCEEMLETPNSNSPVEATTVTPSAPM